MPTIERTADDIYYDSLMKLYNDVYNLVKLTFPEINISNVPDYSPLHQTILKKYLDFPKMYNKIFKGQEVRTITDPKGNTWYEVDIPENFLDMELLYKKDVKLIKRFK